MKTPLVLLVEDDYLIKKISVILLKQLNCIVDIASTGEEALEHIQKVKYDLILMDIGLPDMDGIAVIRKIRQSTNMNQDVPIITLTAHFCDAEYMAQSFDAGANEYLAKPFNIDIGQTLLQRFVA